MARKRVVKKDNRKKTAKIKPLSQTHIKRTMINNGMSLGLLNSSRTFTTGDVPAMMEDDQVALGLEYLKIPIAQAPIAVKVSHPEAHAWATDLYQRIWNALIPKIDLALAYGENAYEPMYRKDKKNPQWWDFADDFDVAPPMSSIPWTTNEKIAFVAVHDSFGIGNMGYYWFETGEVPEGCSILEGAGVYRPSKVIWVANDCLTSRWYGRSVLRAAHLRWKGKNMPDGCLENLLKASFKSAFSGTLLRYPAGDSVVSADGSIITSEEFADFILQVMKTGSGIRLPAKMKDGIGWDVEEYAKNLVDPEKVQAPLDYLDRGILRGMGIPDEVLTHDGSTGGYSRSLVSIDAFYSRGETRAQTILPSITEMIVNPLGRQRYGPQFEATAHIMRQQRPDGGEQNQDADGNGIPDALEGAMQGNDQGQEQDNQQNGNFQNDGQQVKEKPQGQAPFSVSHRASNDALSFGCIASGVAIHAKDTGRLLLLQRANNEEDKAAGMWEFPGGHIEDGESEFEAAVREWQEETGNEFPKGKRIGKWKASNGRYMGFIYSVPKESSIDIHQGKDRAIMNPDDPDGDAIEVAAWFDPDHLLENPAIRKELAEDIPAILKKIP